MLDELIELISLIWGADAALRDSSVVAEPSPRSGLEDTSNQEDTADGR